MTGAIHRLLEEAADQVEAGEPVDTFIQTQLAGEGYILSALDKDVAEILGRRAEES